MIDFQWKVNTDQWNAENVKGLWPRKHQSAFYVELGIQTKNVYCDYYWVGSIVASNPGDTWEFTPDYSQHATDTHAG